MDTKSRITMIERKANGIEGLIHSLYRRSEGLRKAKTRFPAYKSRLEKLATDHEAAAKKMQKEYLVTADRAIKTTKKNLINLHDPGIKNVVINGTYYEVEELYDKAYALYLRLFKRYNALIKEVNKKTPPTRRRK